MSPEIDILYDKYIKEHRLLAKDVLHATYRNARHDIDETVEIEFKEEQVVNHIVVFRLTEKFGGLQSGIGMMVGAKA